MTRVDLDPGEARAVRQLLADRVLDEGALELVRDGRVLQRVDRLRGPLRDAGAGAVAAGVAHRIDVDAGPVGAFAAARPALLPELPAVRAAAPLRRLAPLWRWLTADGVFAVSIRQPDAPPVVVCARIRDGRLERLTGGSALALPERADADGQLLTAVRRRLGRPRAVVAGSLSALRAVVESRRPATAFERGRMRGEIEVPLLSGRLSFALFLLRLLGR